MTDQPQVPAKIEDYAQAQVPDFIKREKAGQGVENLSSNAWTPPRLKLAQSLSPELQTIPGLKPGDFFNDITQQVYGNKVPVVVCYMTEAYFLFAPRVPGTAGGLLARAIDGVHWEPSDGVFDVIIDKKGRKVQWATAPTVMQSGLDKWGSFDPDDNSSQPAATHAINMVVLLPTFLEDGPMVFSFMRSGIKHGKKLAGSFKLSRVPSFGRVTELIGKQTENDHGGFHFEPQYRAAGFVNNKSVYEMGEEIYKISREKGVDIDLSGDVGEAAGEAREPSEAPKDEGKY